MTENMKAFFEYVSEQEEEVRAMASSLKMAELINFAASKGFTLTEDDFDEDDEDEGEIGFDEADDAAGGGDCFCAVAGGGTPGYKDEACACVVGGWGETTYYGSRCHCPIGGYGASRDE